MIHPSGIHQAIVDKVVARRGRLHAFPMLNAVKTALVVVDLDEASVHRLGDTTIIPVVNKLATTVRAAGGQVAWVTTPISEPTANFKAVFGESLAQSYAQEVDDDKVWRELKTKPNDMYATKSGHSAFFPGKCNLHEQLQARGIISILITGLVTNVCCEASARDAAECGYQVTMVSDALWGHGFGLHEASLATFFRTYGDVRPANDVLKLLRD